MLYDFKTPEIKEYMYYGFQEDIFESMKADSSDPFSSDPFQTTTTTSSTPATSPPIDTGSNAEKKSVSTCYLDIQILERLRKVHWSCIVEKINKNLS